jgi:hypothetical protein
MGMKRAFSVTPSLSRGQREAEAIMRGEAKTNLNRHGCWFKQVCAFVHRVSHRFALIPRCARNDRLAAWVAIVAFFLPWGAGTCLAQYSPIPNFVGNLAGQQFRNAINGMFSGSTQSSPQLVHLYSYQLPSTVVNGQLYYVNDGAPGNPCKAGGSGAVAMGVNGQWVCGAPGTQVQSVLAYGALDNCSTPADAAIQAAIDATPNNGNDGSNPVYLPATPGTSNGSTSYCYLLSKPLALTHGGINLYGDGREQTFVNANYYGPLIVAGTDTLSLTTSLLSSGGGNAVNLTSTPFLELSMLLRNHLNGHTAFSIEFELNVPASPSNSVILQSAYDWPYQTYSRSGLTDVGAFAINYQSSNPHLSMTATLSSSGVVTINTANNSMSSGNHAVGFYYDGSHLWSCIDGTANTPTSATGTWIQSKWESITLPDEYGNGAITWPDGAGGGGVSNDSFNGTIDNLRISNTNRATSGNCPSVPTAKFTYDSNTDLLLKGLSCGDGSQYCLENSTGEYAVYAQSQYAPGTSSYSTSNNGVWFPVLGEHGPSVNHLWIHDLTLGWSAWTQGVYILNSAWSQFERLAGIGEHNGLNLYYLDYESTVRENRWLASGHTGYQGYELGYATNTQNFENDAAEEAFVCFNLESAQTGFEEKSGHCLVDGETAIGWLVDYASGTLLDPLLDQEVADTMVAPVYFRGASNEGGLKIVGGNLDTYGGVPFIIHDAGGYGPVTAVGTLFNNFGEDQPASSVIQFPGLVTYGSLAGTIWQSQHTIAENPTIANAPGTCSGTGGDTNCAQFVYRAGMSSFVLNTPCTLVSSTWTCTNTTSASAATWLGNPNFSGSEGTFSSSNNIGDSYILLTGQLYLTKGANPGHIFTLGAFNGSCGCSGEFKISSLSLDVDLKSGGDTDFIATASSAGFYTFQLSFGAATSEGSYDALSSLEASVSPGAISTNLPAEADVLNDIVMADSNLPLSNEVGNAHIEWTGRPPDQDAYGPIIGQQDHYIP